MKGRNKSLLFVAFLAASTTLFSGCGKQDQAANAAVGSPTPASVQPKASAPAQTPLSALPGTTPSAKQEQSGNVVHPASAKDADLQETGAGNTQEKKASFDAYTSTKPVLMGIAIGDKRSKVIDLHGDPVDQYTMEDETDPIHVLDYEGFAIGLNQDDLVAFVEVTSEDIDAGLNGLEPGKKADDALQILGKPDTNTGYVLSYKTKTSVLKLDIDPKTKKIESIKLFGRSE